MTTGAIFTRECRMRSSIDIFRHDHMDGAICVLSILEDLYKLSGLELPKEVRDYQNLAELKDNLRRWYASPQIDIERKFRIVTNVMQNPDTLFLIAENHVRVRAAQGLRYVDAICAPEYAVRGDKKSAANLTVKEGIAALIEGIKSGEKKYPGIEVNLVCAFDRSNTPERAVELVDIFSECDRDYVVATDMVCDEATYGPQIHIPAFKRAKERGLRRNCHAAEWVKNRPDGEKETAEQIMRNFQEDLPGRLVNLRTALFELEADFINHGLGLFLDRQLMEFMAKRKIGVSVCPGNYIASKLVPRVDAIGIPILLEAGVPVVIDVDDDLMFDGIEPVVKMCGLAPEQVSKLNRNAWMTRPGNRKQH